MPRRSLLWPDPRVKPPFGSAEIDWGHPLAQGLVSFWLFNESAGTAYDIVRRIPAILIGGTTWIVGLDGSAISTPGSAGDYVSISPAAEFVPTPLTVIFKAKQNATPEAYRTLLMHGNSDWAGGGWGFRWDSSTELHFWVDQYDANIGHGPITAPMDWHTYAGRYDKTDVRLFDNGVLTGNPDPYTATLSNGGTTSFRISIDGSGSYAVNQQVSYCGIWSTALSADALLWQSRKPYIFLRPILRRRYSVPAAGVTPAVGSDALALRLLDATTGLSVSLIATDTPSMKLAEAAALFQASAVADSLGLPVTDVAMIFQAAAVAESLGIRVVDVSALLATLQALDSLGLGLSEAVAALVALQQLESLGLRLSEIARLDVALLTADVTPLRLSETVTALSAFLMFADSVGIGLQEAEAILATLTAPGDLLATPLGERADVSVFALVAALDAFGVQISESTALSVLQAVADALGIELVEPGDVFVALAGLLDLLAVRLSESAAMDVAVRVAEALEVPVAEAMRLLVPLAQAETLGISVQELAALAESLRTGDVLSSRLEELSVILAGTPVQTGRVIVSSVRTLMPTREVRPVRTYTVELV